MNKTTRQYNSHNSKPSFLFILCASLVIALCAAIGFWIVNNNQNYTDNNIISSNQADNGKSAEEIINEYAANNGLSLKDYPQSMIDLLDRNKETKDFVLSYPDEKDKKHKVNINEYRHCSEVPLFMQWDKRWGYIMYGDDVAGLTGCGPVCLSMAAVYLLQDTKYSPDYMLEWAKENGYCVDGSGSLWTLISEGGEKLGLDVTEIPLDKQRIINNLEVGNPIICIMGPGDFTTKGHFIVMTGLKDGKIKINDPNSIENSNKLWNYDDICNQINNLWVMRSK